MPSKSKSDTPIGSDICKCGDYRSQHGYGENAQCRVCGGMTGPGNGCQAFVFSRCATDEELKHWRTTLYGNGNVKDASLILQGWYVVKKGRVKAGDRYWDAKRLAWLPITVNDRRSAPEFQALIRKVTL
jgi:hypothetical protein